jgi:hypothetical protein
MLQERIRDTPIRPPSRMLSAKIIRHHDPVFLLAFARTDRY